MPRVIEDTEAGEHKHAMNSLLSLGCKLVRALNSVGTWLPQLALRLLLAWEFYGMGIDKLHGHNSFAALHANLPTPFNLVSVDIVWFVVVWTELIGASALLSGLFTRFAAAALIVIDMVTWMLIHASHGYNVCANGYKLSLFYLVMLLPLLFNGAGKASLDYWLVRYFRAP